MHSRSKVVEAGGKSFQIERLPPEVGSFIFMRMLGVSMRSQAEAAQGTVSKPTEAKQDAPAEETKISGEMKVRALVFSVFSGGVNFDDFKFIQRSCMQVVRLNNEFGLPMPVMSDTGVWTKDGESLEYNVGLVMKLTMEVLIFCFADFFDGDGPGL